MLLARSSLIRSHVHCFRNLLNVTRYFDLSNLLASCAVFQA